MFRMPVVFPHMVPELRCAWPDVMPWEVCRLAGQPALEAFSRIQMLRKATARDIDVLSFQYLLEFLVLSRAKHLLLLKLVCRKDIFASIGPLPTRVQNHIFEYLQLRSDEMPTMLYCSPPYAMALQGWWMPIAWQQWSVSVAQMHDIRSDVKLEMEREYSVHEGLKRKCLKHNHALGAIIRKYRGLWFSSELRRLSWRREEMSLRSYARHHMSEVRG